MPGQRRNRGVLIGIVIAVVFAIAGLVIFGIVAKSTGAGGFTWGLVFASLTLATIRRPPPRSAGVETTRLRSATRRRT